MAKRRLFLGGGIGLILGLAAALLACRGSLDTCGPLVWLFGPRTVTPTEAYAGDTGGPAVDHGRLDRLLRAHVTPEGWVDYAALAAAPAELDTYLVELSVLPYERLSRDEKLAALINAYNAFTLKLMVDHWPIDSIKAIPSADRWKAARWRFGGQVVSLDAIEHLYLRARFAEPRIHFAIVCASVGCPPLRAEAYRADALEAQLEDQARRVHAPGSRWITVEGDTVTLTPLYQWFSGDFEAAAGSVLAFVARYRPELAGRTPTVRWLPYDWGVNGLR